MPAIQSPVKTSSWLAWGPSLSAQDIVVVVMGSTGSGKSNFIDQLFGTTEKKRAGHSLHSHTAEISPERNNGQNPDFSSNLVIVDTPGFDDTSRSDLEILTAIADWMKKTYEDHIKVAAIIYLHRIQDNRMSGALLRNLRMFGKLTGEAAAGKVLLTSTMWDRKPKNEGEWEAREKELCQSFWEPLISQHARTARFYNSRDSANDVMNEAIHPSQLHRVEKSLSAVDALLVQEEMAVFKRALQETSAGQELYNDLQRLLLRQKQTLEKLRDEVRKLDNPSAIQVLEREVDTIYKELSSTYTSVAALKLPLLRWLRLRLADLFQRNRSRPVNIGQAQES